MEGKWVVIISELGADLVMDLCALCIWELSLDWKPKMVSLEDGQSGQ